MVTFGPAEILFALLGLLLCSLIAGMFLTWGWVVQQLALRRPILPEQPMVIDRQTPWGMGTVLLVVLVYLIVSGAITLAYTKATGRSPVEPPAAPKAVTERSREPHEVKGPAPAESGEARTELPAAGPGVDGQLPPRQAAATAPREVKAPRASAPPAEPATAEPASSQIEKMAVFLVTDLVLIVLLPLIVRMTSGARLRDLGLSFEGWWPQAAVGIVATLAAAPLVYSVFLLATTIWKPNAHPLQEMLLKELSPGVAELAILSGVVVAPIFEELLFRGILQSWLVRLLGRRAPLPPPPVIELAESAGEISLLSPEYLLPPPPVVGLAESPADSTSWDPDFGYVEGDAQNGLAAQAPSMPGPAKDAPVRSGKLGIILTSLLFAAVHAPQWPAPVGLFFLALVIGTVYHRTGSLIAAIFLHATFNGLSTLAMFMAILAGQIVDWNKPAAAAKPPAAIGSQVLCERGWVHQSP